MAENKLPVFPKVKGVDINTLTPEEDQYVFLAENDTNVDCLKTEPYLLNMRALYKKLLKNIATQSSIDRKDSGNQFTISTNTVTYMIMINGLIGTKDQSNQN